MGTRLPRAAGIARSAVGTRRMDDRNGEPQHPSIRGASMRDSSLLMATASTASLEAKPSIRGIPKTASFYRVVVGSTVQCMASPFRKMERNLPPVVTIAKSKSGSWISSSLDFPKRRESCSESIILIRFDNSLQKCRRDVTLIPLKSACYISGARDPQPR